eukprot:scaffold8743_cov117-Skeletonema_marinoi.AAC.1
MHCCASPSPGKCFNDGGREPCPCTVSYGAHDGIMPIIRQPKGWWQLAYLCLANPDSNGIVEQTM